MLCLLFHVYYRHFSRFYSLFFCIFPLCCTSSNLLSSFSLLVSVLYHCLWYCLLSFGVCLLPSPTVLLEIIHCFVDRLTMRKYRSSGIRRVWIVCCFLFMTIHLQQLSMILLGLLLFDLYTRKLFENGS